MADPKNSKVPAYIIGDKKTGLTIIVTDPIMVVRYSIDDLKDETFNKMLPAEPIESMAAIVQELMPLLRGVDVDKLVARAEAMRARPADYPLNEIEQVLDELSYARTYGQLIANNGTVCDVDFCVAVEVDPCGIAARARSVSPSLNVIDYLKDQCDPQGGGTLSSSHPKKFPLDNLEKDNLRPPDPWQDPRSGT